ncbi:aromatic acid exporter family protein [Citricoccus sp. GCM10030269]|uniref:FUSC family protein n=1 Tax=Citricoccus sp. GCM10030269 TaxID=3273388 RepID=UPI003607A496
MEQHPASSSTWTTTARRMWERSRSFAARRARAGAARVRSSVVPAALSAICAVLAYGFAELVLGHENPLFAATASLIALGFNRDPKVRKVIEVAVGCTLGILIGDLMQAALGQGYWQALLVVFTSIMVARFLDSGSVFTLQMSLQAILVVLLPTAEGGPFTRSQDAVVGGFIALVVTLLYPKNLQKDAATGLRELYRTVALTLRDCSEALRSHESRTAWMGLVACRGTQTAVDNLQKDVRNAREVATFSPTQRRSRPQLDSMAHTVEMSDLAVRSLRIAARRVISVIDNAALDDESTEKLADWFDEAADAVGILGRSLGEPAARGRHKSLSVARDALGSAAAQLDPAELGATTLHSEALVMLLRPMMVDLLEATGASHDEAVSYLPRL